MIVKRMSLFTARRFFQDGEKPEVQRTDER